jgi:hypothetical protein
VQDAANPRRLGTAYVNLAGVKIVQGDFASAERELAVARRQAELSQLWWLRRLAVVYEADYHIARGHPEAAWPLVEEATRLTQPNGYRLSGVDYERLLMLYASATGGERAVRELKKTWTSWKPFHIRDRHILAAVEEWVCGQHGIECRPGASGFEQLRGLGFHGTVAFLGRLGITPQVP